MKDEKADGPESSGEAPRRQDDAMLPPAGAAKSPFPIHRSLLTADSLPSPPEPMTPFDLRAVLLRDLASLRLELEAYPEESQLWAAPAGISNSAGTLAMHCAGNLQHFIGCCLGGTGYVRDRDGEFGRRDVPRAELVAGLEAAAQVVEQVLPGLDSARLDEDFPFDFKGRTVPTGRFLLHLATHLAYHLGQVDYHRRAVTGQGALAGVVGIPFQQ